MPVLNLGVDLPSVDTSRPVLAKGNYPCRIKSIETKDSKKGDSQYLEITLSLEQEAEGTKGQPVMPGFELRDRLGITSTPKYDPAPRIARFVDSVLGTNQETRPATFDTDDYVGKEVTVVVDVENDPTYGESNNVKRYVANS